MLINIFTSLIKQESERIMLLRRTCHSKIGFTREYSIDFRLTESETKTILNIFADHEGMIIDPFGIRGKLTADMYGIRISPKQSPVYQLMVRSIRILL